VSAVRIQLAAKSEGAHGSSQSSSVWELRDKMPADVLREIELETGAQEALPAGPVRLDKMVAGEVRTVSDVAQGDSSLSRTAVGLHGGLPNGWQYDLRGDYAAVSAPAGISDTTATAGNAAGLALDVAMSPLDRVSLTTRRHTLSLHDDRVASLQTHGVSWSRDGDEGNVESVAARYVEEANLYRATSPGSSFFPLASRTWEVRANYARPASDSPGVSVAMTYRHREGTIGPSGVGSDGAFLMSAPDRDLYAGSSVRVSSRAEVEGSRGPVSRGRIRHRAAPGGALRARRQDLRFRAWPLPGRPIGHSFRNRASARDLRGRERRSDLPQRFILGLERRAGPDGSFHFEASDQRINETVRAFFEGDFLTDFDSVYLFDGNSVRQYKLSGSQRLNDKLSGSIGLRYGMIGGDPTADSGKSFGITANKGHFWSARAAVEIVPTRTGVAVIVRGVRQSLATAAAVQSNDSSKIAISLAQDLSVVGVNPFGSICKLLVALESATAPP
jgi:hypothetical protein